MLPETALVGRVRFQLQPGRKPGQQPADGLEMRRPGAVLARRLLDGHACPERPGSEVTEHRFGEPVGHGDPGGTVGDRRRMRIGQRGGGRTRAGCRCPRWRGDRSLVEGRRTSADEHGTGPSEEVATHVPEGYPRGTAWGLPNGRTSVLYCPHDRASDGHDGRPDDPPGTVGRGHRASGSGGVPRHGRSDQRCGGEHGRARAGTAAKGRWA